MSLDRQRCYRALRARDARFDGVFFNAVKTTGIYCRPICPARTPMLERCTFFPSAAAAERAGYRGCLQCRPELAPNARLEGAPSFVQAALARIEAGYLNEGGHDLQGLAREVGVTAAELDGALEAARGATALELAETQRIALAKRLLTDTKLSIRDVAELSGFASSRRLQATFRARLGRPATELRRTAAALASDPKTLRLRLDYRPPFDHATVFGFLGVRAMPGLERVDGPAYRRSIRIGERSGWLQVEPDPKRNALVATIPVSLGDRILPLVAAARELFDLDARPDRIGECLGSDPQLSRHVAARPGLRVPGSISRFETAVRAVVGQQVSVAAATTLCGRIVRRFGSPVETPWPEIDRLFPEPAKLVAAGISELASIGMPRSRATTLYELARAIADRRLDLDRVVDPEQALTELCRVPGIGPWTAQYIQMRVLHWPDAFPAGDLGVRKALGMPSTAAAERSSQSWRPFRAYAVMHLWHAQANA